MTPTALRRLSATLALIISVAFCFADTHEVAVKTNLVYDALTTPNIGFEIGMGKKTTAQLFYGVNPWTYDRSTLDVKKMKHWSLLGEYRWWHCSKFNGSFIGIHAFGGQFNAGNMDIPFPGMFFGGDNISKTLNDFRYEGTMAGVGFSYGYQWMLSEHWNFEASAGVGYAHAWYDKHACGMCGALLDKGSTNYVGLTRLALSLLYIF